MVLNIILLIIGFVILIKGADLFVDGASNIALNFKVSKMLIGARKSTRLNSSHTS